MLNGGILLTDFVGSKIWQKGDILIFKDGIIIGVVGNVCRLYPKNIRTILSGWRSFESLHELNSQEMNGIAVRLHYDQKVYINSLA